MSSGPTPDVDSAMDSLPHTARSESNPGPLTRTINPGAEDIRHQVEQEQALTDAQSRLKDLEVEVEKLKGEIQALQGEKIESLSTTNQLRTQLSSVQSIHHKSTSELAVLQTRLDAIESEKRELLEELERLQQRSNRNTQEVFTLRSQRAEASQKVAHLDVEVSELRMAADSAKFNEERSVQALTGARAEILNLSKAAADVEERFGKYRAEKQAELSQVQVDHDSITSRLTSTDHSYRSLQRTYNDQSRRLAEAHANIATLTSSAAAKKASTSMEFRRLTEENRVLEKRGDDARATITDREAELERMVQSYDEKERVWEERWKKEERMRRESEKRAEELKIVVERLALAGGNGTDISPAAALASGMKQSGKTYTQFYTDYTIQEGRLRTAENEVARLTHMMDEIGQDIEEKKAILEDQATEYAQATERANALAGELATVMSSRDAQEARAKLLAAAASLHTGETSSLRTTVDDLSRQVQGLLRQIATRDDPSLANVTMDGTAITDGDVITDRLLEFKSIRSLQEQNQKLLKLTRGLMAKLDDREIRRATSDADDVDTGATLDQATETISRLHTQLLDAQKKINEVTRERDFFSKLLAKGEGLNWSQKGTLGMLDDEAGPHAQTISTLQAEMDVVRTKAEADISEAKEQARVQAENAGMAQVDKARAEAKIALLEEQHRTLSETGSIQKGEFSNLEAQLLQLQGAVGQAHNERRSALEQVASRQAEADRCRNEAASLRAEKEQRESTEARLQADFRTVQSERARLQQLIENLNNVSSENERTRSEERSRLEGRIEDLQRYMTALRGQLEQAREATRTAEKRAEDLDARVEAATASVRAEKDAAESLSTARSAEITSLTGELEKVRGDSENRLRIGNNWRQRATKLQETQTEMVTEHSGTIAAKDKEIAEVNGKITTLNKEIEETKGKISDLERKLTDSERGSQLKEGTVQRLQSELIAGRNHTGANTATTAATESLAPATGQDGPAMSALQTERDSLQQRLSQAEKDLEAARAAVSSSSAGGSAGPVTEEEKVELQQRVEAIEREKEDYVRKYENNVLQVNRVNASLRNRLTELTGDKTSAESRITELEQELADLRAGAPPPVLDAASTDTADTPASTASGSFDQAAIDKAVRTAVAAKEAELTKALEEARAAVKTEPSAPVQSTSVDEPLHKRIAELEKERNDLKGQVEELQQKLKTLERQAKTAEISRKTLERQKTEVEAKLKKLETGEGSTTSASAGALEAAPAFPSATPAGPSGTTSTTPATPATSQDPAAATTTAAPAVTTPTAPARGTPRGRVRAGARGTRGGAAGTRPNPVLSAVNATLAQSSSPAPTSPTGTKRPLPEEGEIPDSAEAGGADGGIIQRIQGNAVASRSGTGTTGERGRVLKRPRGAGPSRGSPVAARGGRRPSAPSAEMEGGGGDGGTGTGTGDGAEGGGAASGDGGAAPPS